MLICLLCFRLKRGNLKSSQGSRRLLESFLWLFVHACICGTPQSALKVTAAILTCSSAPAGGVLIAVVPAVVVPVTGPVVWDAAATGALELGVGAGPGAAHFIAAVPTVVICNQTNDGWRLELLWRMSAISKKPMQGGGVT